MLREEKVRGLVSSGEWRTADPSFSLQFPEVAGEENFHYFVAKPMAKY